MCLPPRIFRSFSSLAKICRSAGRTTSARETAFIRAFNEHVIWEKGSHKLGFTYKDTRRIRFYAGLENVLRQSCSTLFSGIPGESPDAHEDKRRLGVLYVIDWVLRQSIGKFTLSD